MTVEADSLVFEPNAWTGTRATLREWRSDGAFLHGLVSNHPDHPDGTGVRTSLVRWMNESRTLALTKNTLYTLEGPER